ncbi:hypothetical protein ACI797_03730 [Geodermatophilus sp. SYSU D00691]
MSPLRWDVLGVGFLLSLPLLAMYVRGDLTVEEMTARLPWCLLAAYLAVALLRWASKPRTPAPSRRATEPADPTPTA